jgi:hypothetical protein
VDNDGNALLTGAIYFNSVAAEMRVWNGSTWQPQAASPDTLTERNFTGTAGQTSYTVTGGYRVDYTFVWVNGVLLSAADITATNGTDITFTSALALNDEVRILSFKAVGTVAIADINGLQTALDGKLSTAAGAVGTANLANSAVTTAKVADANITTAKIADANVTAAKATDPTDIRDLLVKQVTGTVRWRECVAAMAAMGCDKFVEVGAGKVLTGLMKRNAPEATALAIGNPAELEAFLKTL